MLELQYITLLQSFITVQSTVTIIAQVSCLAASCILLALQQLCLSWLLWQNAACRTNALDHLFEDLSTLPMGRLTDRTVKRVPCSTCSEVLVKGHGVGGRLQPSHDTRLLVLAPHASQRNLSCPYAAEPQTSCCGSG